MTEDDTVLEMTSDEVQKSKTPPRLKRRRFAPIKIANQIPMRRRKEIEKALGEVSSVLDDLLTNTRKLYIFPNF